MVEQFCAHAQLHGHVSEPRSSLYVFTVFFSKYLSCSHDCSGLSFAFGKSIVRIGPFCSFNLQRVLSAYKKKTLVSFLSRIVVHGFGLVMARESRAKTRPEYNYLDSVISCVWDSI